MRFGMYSGIQSPVVASTSSPESRFGSARFEEARTRRSSERAPAVTPSGDAAVLGSWHPSLTLALGNIKMILAFANDATVQIFRTESQIPTYCEAIDVEEGEYVFLDARGYVLRPVFSASAKGRFLFITFVGDGAFTLVPTDERRGDLIRGLVSGGISIHPEPSTVKSLDELRAAAPLLFSP